MRSLFLALFLLLVATGFTDEGASALLHAVQIVTAEYKADPAATVALISKTLVITWALSWALLWMLGAANGGSLVAKLRIGNDAEITANEADRLLAICAEARGDHPALATGAVNVDAVRFWLSALAARGDRRAAHLLTLGEERFFRVLEEAAQRSTSSEGRALAA